MADPNGIARRQLLARISARRERIDRFLRAARPEHHRLVNTALAGSAVAALLVAGPALGGEAFTSGLASDLGLAGGTQVWRGACLLALLAAVAAALAVHRARSRDTAHRIAVAEAVDAELDGLQTLLEFGQLPVFDAVRLYQGYVAKIPWIEERRSRPAGAPQHPSPRHSGTVPAQRRSPEERTAPPDVPRQGGVHREP